LTECCPNRVHGETLVRAGRSHTTVQLKKEESEMIEVNEAAVVLARKVAEG
jgi:hypothetical protein